MWLFISHVVSLFSLRFTFLLTATRAKESEGLPDSIKRVGQTESFPNEYPGQIYAFNWCLNGDGVTPLKRSAFRITKPLDLKIAGLSPPKKTPLQVRLSCIEYPFHYSILFSKSELELMIILLLLHRSRPLTLRKFPRLGRTVFRSSILMK
jgi:hypothetical protein